METGAYQTIDTPDFHLNDHEVAEKKKSRFWRPGSLLALSLLAGMLLFAFLGRKSVNLSFSDDKSDEFMSLSRDPAKKSNMRITNRYTERDGPAGEEYPYLTDKVVLEPYQETQFKVADPEDDMKYKWVVVNGEREIVEVQEGVLLVTTFTQLYEQFTINLYRAIGESNDYHLLGTQDAVVKYVRRELRQLFEEDKQAILAAMRIMYNVAQSKGEMEYGESYLSMLELHKIHLIMAGQIDCDHMHPGYGFANHHIALSNLFEKALQAVNPKIALPYWNYIRDIEEWQQEWYLQDAAGLDTPDWNNWGPMNDWFGGTTEEGFIANGPFAYMQVPTVDDLEDTEKEWIPHNGYGQLRAPWNNNPNDHIVRHSSKCGLGPENWFNEIDGRCKGLIQDLKHVDNLLDWIEDVSASPHVLVHILLGGSLGCEDALDTLVPLFGDETVDNLRQVWYDMSKALVRDGVINCDEPGDCFCPLYDTYISDNFVLDSLVPDGIHCCHTVDTSSWSDLSMDDKRIVINAVCNSGLYNGDALEASSTGAPEFWFLHQFMDRLYQYHYLRYPFADTDFGEGGYWQGQGTEGTCWGHDADDRVLGGYGSVYQYGEKKQKTHAEYALLLSPEVENGFGYIYADFDYSFCDDYGPSI